MSNLPHIVNIKSDLTLHNVDYARVAPKATWAIAQVAGRNDT